VHLSKLQQILLDPIAIRLDSSLTFIYVYIILEIKQSINNSYSEGM